MAPFIPPTVRLHNIWQEAATGKWSIRVYVHIIGSCCSHCEIPLCTNHRTPPRLYVCSPASSRQTLIHCCCCASLTSPWGAQEGNNINACIKYCLILSHIRDTLTVHVHNFTCHLYTKWGPLVMTEQKWHFIVFSLWLPTDIFCIIELTTQIQTCIHRYTPPHMLATTKTSTSHFLLFVYLWLLTQKDVRLFLLGGWITDFGNSYSDGMLRTASDQS